MSGTKRLNPPPELVSPAGRSGLRLSKEHERCHQESELKPASSPAIFSYSRELHHPAPRPRDGKLPRGHGGSSGRGFAEKVGLLRVL